MAANDFVNVHVLTYGTFRDRLYNSEFQNHARVISRLINVEYVCVSRVACRNRGIVRLSEPFDKNTLKGILMSYVRFHAFRNKNDGNNEMNILISPYIIIGHLIFSFRGKERKELVFNPIHRIII